MLTGVKGKGGREKEEKLYFSIGVVKMSIQRQVLKVCLWPRRMEVVMPWQWSGRGAADGQARNVKAVHSGAQEDGGGDALALSWGHLPWAHPASLNCEPSLRCRHWGYTCPTLGPHSPAEKRDGGMTFFSCL